MEKKKGGFLRWPWNIVIYILLVLVLRVFAVPLILVLIGVQHKYNPHGMAEGYCLSRTRKRLTWLIWALLMLAVSAALFYMFQAGLKQDMVYWETADYVTLAVCGIGGLLLSIAGLYVGYAAVRDTFFPEKSALAKSIRNQLPYPNEAPPADKLFAMVDQDLKENGQWFGPVGIGREWVLGDGVNKIDRIRGIFTVNKLHMHHTNTGTRTSRDMELVLIDNRWQRTVTSFQNQQDLQAAADCLSLRVPDAKRGVNDANMDFWTMDEEAREEFEREFRKKQARRASEHLQRETVGSQNMILYQTDGQVTSRVTTALVEEQLALCLKDGGGRFRLTPSQPMESAGKAFRALHVSVSEGTVRLLMEFQNQPGCGMSKALEEQAARKILSGWLRREVPDTTSWELRQIFDPSRQQDAWKSQSQEETAGNELKK